MDTTPQSLQASFHDSPERLGYTWNVDYTGEHWPGAYSAHKR